MKIFSPDSTFMRTLSLIADFFLLNVLTIVFSIPIFTAGAAVTALYTVMGRLVRSEDYELKDFFIAFKSNFKQATVAWLLLTAAGAALVATFVLCGIFGGSVTVIVSYIVYAVAALWLVAYSWTFPLISQFDNKPNLSIANALQLGIAHLPRSIIIAALNILPWAFLYFRINFFLRFVPLWLLFWFSIVAYFSSMLIKKPFEPFRKAGLPSDSGNEYPDDDAQTDTSSAAGYSDEEAWAALTASFNTSDDLAPEEDETSYDDPSDYDHSGDDLSDDSPDGADE